MPQWTRMASPPAVGVRPVAEERWVATSPRGSHKPVAADRSKVWRVTRMMVLTKGCHSVAAKASPTGKTSTVRSSWRERPVLRAKALSAGPALSAMIQTASNSLAWLAFSWTRRWLPVSRAISKVFLTVHGIQGEQAAGQAEGGDHLLGGGDLVAFVRNRQVAENDLAVGGKGAQQMRRLAVVESVEAAAQGFPVNGHRCWDACALGRNVRQSGGMRAERPLDLRGVEAAQDEAHRRIGRRAAQRQAKPAVQAIQMGPDERVNLTIRPRSGQHAEHREQQDRRQRIHLPLIAAWIGKRGEQRQQHTRHRGNPSRWLPDIDSDKTRRGNRFSCPTSRCSPDQDVSVEQPWAFGGHCIENYFVPVSIAAGLRGH